MGSKKNTSQIIGLFLGIIIFLLLNFFPVLDGITENKMLSVAVLMALWWMTEAIPLAATAMIPVVVFPLLGILHVKDTASQYFNSIIFLFIGGFLIALAMEKWNLHKRISLMIINAIGGGPAKIIFGFMVSCVLMSMFISNTATTIMMLPIGLAIIFKLEDIYDKEKTRKFSIALMLGIAYASSVGGIATLVGTAPNLAFIRIYTITFPDAPEITFGQWVIFGIPLAVTMMMIIWFLLTKVIFKPDKSIVIDPKIVKDELSALGKISFEERAVLLTLLTTGILWIFRKDITLGFLTIPGWSNLLPFGDLIDDGTVAIMTSSIMFLLPSKTKGKRLIDNEIFKKLPWDIILLFGGGFALAKGFQSSGLSMAIGEQFVRFGGISPLLLIMLVCIGLTFLTELTSNTATTHTLLPILASLSVALNINPLLLMIPATLSASFAFMLPVATPPNAIVFSSDRIMINDMMRAGIILNLIGVLVVSLFFTTLGVEVFGVDMNQFPLWAEPK